MAGDSSGLVSCFSCLPQPRKILNRFGGFIGFAGIVTVYSIKPGINSEVFLYIKCLQCVEYILYIIERLFVIKLLVKLEFKKKLQNQKNFFFMAAGSIKPFKRNKIIFYANVSLQHNRDIN